MRHSIRRACEATGVSPKIHSRSASVVLLRMLAIFVMAVTDMRRRVHLIHVAEDGRIQTGKWVPVEKYGKSRVHTLNLSAQVPVAKATLISHWEKR